MPVRVGVIGTGMIGADHVERLHSRVVGAQVSAVFDVATQRAEQVAASVGACALDSWEAVLASPQVDAVLIASPGELHPDQAIACIQAGKPVLCEKPLATTGGEAARVLEAEVLAGRRLVQVGFMRRYDPGYLEVKAAISNGTIGVPLLAHAIHRNATVPGFWRGEMALTDSLVHEFDVFRWLFDAEIVSVTVIPVTASPLAANGIRDPQIVIVHLDGGQVVTMESFVNCQYGYDVRCEVVGSTGTVSLEHPRSTAVLSADSRGEAIPADWRARFAAAYLDELQSWVDALVAGEASGPSTWDGYAATVVAQAAVRSFTTNTPTTVTLPPRPALYT